MIDWLTSPYSAGATNVDLIVAMAVMMAGGFSAGVHWMTGRKG